MNNIDDFIFSIALNNSIMSSSYWCLCRLCNFSVTVMMMWWCTLIIDDVPYQPTLIWRFLVEFLHLHFIKVVFFLRKICLSILAYWAQCISFLSKLLYIHEIVDWWVIDRLKLILNIRVWMTYSSELHNSIDFFFYFIFV